MKFIINLLAFFSLSLSAQQAAFTIADTDKACAVNDDCTSLSTECCGTGGLMMAVSRAKLSSVKANLNNFCHKLKNDDYDKQSAENKTKRDAAQASCEKDKPCFLPSFTYKDICTGKTRSYNVPTVPVVCENKVCKIK